jgi:hypothetical protein
VFRGHFVDRCLPVGADVFREHEAALTTLARRGYHGPVSIDAMVGFLGDQAFLRPITEINARWSFGRLALALDDHVPDNWSYLWWHPAAKRFPRGGEEMPEIHTQRTSAGLFRLPDFADSCCRSRTILAAGFETKADAYAALGLELPVIPTSFAELICEGW